MDVHGGYKQLMSRFAGLQKELAHQLRNHHIDQVKMRSQFPFGHVYLTTGKDNFISRFIAYCGYDFKTVDMKMTMSPVTGVNGYLNIDSLVAIATPAIFPIPTVDAMALIKAWKELICPSPATSDL